MNIPFTVPCSECGTENQVEFRLDDDSPTWKCVNGHTNMGFFELEFTVGFKLLARSNHELLARRDNSMSIVLAAMAVDCELSRLWRKWTDIERIAIADRFMTDEEAESELRKYQTITGKIDAVARLMDSKGLDAFVLASDEFRDAVESRYPSLHIGSMMRDLQQSLFWPRNRILHHGYTGYGIKDASRCYNIAELMLGMLRAMDHARRKSFPA